MKGKYKYIWSEIYRRGIMVFIGPTKALKEFVKDWSDNDKIKDEVLHNEDSGDTLGTTYYTDNSGESLIHLLYPPRNADQIAYAVHEAFHAVAFLLEYVGMRLDVNVSDEAYAYLLEYVTRELLTKDNWSDATKKEECKG